MHIQNTNNEEYNTFHNTKMENPGNLFIISTAFIKI